MPSEEIEVAAETPQTTRDLLPPATPPSQSSSLGSVPPKGPRALNTPPTVPLRPAQPPSLNVRRRTLDQAARAGLRTAINMSPPYEEDYVNLADVGDKLPRISPDLNPRNYGFQRLRDFVQASGIVVWRWKDMGTRPPIALVRLTDPPAADTSV